MHDFVVFINLKYVVKVGSSLTIDEACQEIVFLSLAEHKGSNNT